MEQLLKILEDNARLPIEDIATMLNKSPAEVAAMIDLARAHRHHGHQPAGLHRPGPEEGVREHL